MDCVISVMKNLFSSTSTLVLRGPF